MARFNYVTPSKIMKDLSLLNQDCEKIFGEMCKAGAKVVVENVKANAPEGIKNSNMMNCLRISNVYKTPSDDGINVKVAFYGYFENKDGVVTPAPLVANVFEYGRSDSMFPKEPFFRKSFKKSDIEKVMVEIQNNAFKRYQSD